MQVAETCRKFDGMIQWHKMSSEQRLGIKVADLEATGKLGKPMGWGRYLNRWVYAWAFQCEIDGGRARIYRCSTRTSSEQDTFDFVVSDYDLTKETA